MNDFNSDVKAVYEELTGRALSTDEVAEIALALQQFAAFLIDCGQDEALRGAMGISIPQIQASAAPRAVDNTSQSDRLAQGEPAPQVAPTPTGASISVAEPREDASAQDLPAMRAAAPRPAARMAFPVAANDFGLPAKE